MSDLICCDDYFTPEAREVYEKYGVVTPYLDGMYSVREVVITRRGTGLLLNELVNPPINIGEGEGGFKTEVNWAISRFKNIDMTDITEEQIREFVEKKKVVII